jgi:hypothetical protein
MQHGEEDAKKQNASCHRGNYIPESAQAFNNAFGPHKKEVSSEGNAYHFNKQTASG